MTQDISPIVVGGTGGSGTRLVCQLLEFGGVFMGSTEIRNYADDALPMCIFDDASLHGKANISEIFADCLARVRQGAWEGHPWGWKHTRSYLNLPTLHRLCPKMCFIHLIRDGRDIAYAPHISLGVFWTGDMPSFHPHPETVMALWAITNLQAANYGERYLDRYYCLRFEDICLKPIETIQSLYDFLGLDGNARKASTLVKPPSSLGRWKGKPNLGRVVAIGREALERFGYL